jgi:hypothetical protein
VIAPGRRVALGTAAGAAAAAIALAGCAPDRTLVPTDACQASIAAVLYDHACQHGDLGPYEAVIAVGDRSVEPPIVGSAQRVLVVELPHRAGDDDRRSYFAYRPSRDGQHAVFTGAGGHGVEIAILDRGERLHATAIAPVPAALPCGELRWVTGFELVASQVYLVEVGPTSAPVVDVFFEHVESFGGPWQEVCEP